MRKKLLRTFAILVVFIGVLGPIAFHKAHGMYTDQIESLMICQYTLKRMLCKPQWRMVGASHYDTTRSFYVEDEVGKSYTPYGPVTHVKKRLVTHDHRVTDPGKLKWACKSCSRTQSPFVSEMVPTVSFSWVGTNKTLNMKWPGDARIAPRAMVCPGICKTDFAPLVLWQTAGLNEKYMGEIACVLIELWNAAKKEDSKNPTISDGLTNIVDEITPLIETGRNVAHEYGHASSCCCYIL
jgi:hypothetical protein